MAAVRLRVVPNPFAALDAAGNPSGAFPMEGSPGYFVGASLVRNGVDPDVGKMLRGEERAKPRSFTFESDVVELHCSNYYLYALRTGELLAADKQTAAHAGVKFVPVAEALAASKAAAVKRFMAERGESPACADAEKSAEPARAKRAPETDGASSRGGE